MIYILTKNWKQKKWKRPVEKSGKEGHSTMKVYNVRVEVWGSV
jgi:hypothetical protein